MKKFIELNLRIITFIITQINGSILSISMQIGSIQIINETEIDGWGIEFRMKNKKEDRGAEG